KPLGRWVIEAVEATGLGPGTIVTGPEGANFAAGWTVLVNPRPDDGLGSSLAIAAKAALDGEAEALLVLLADMPLVGAGYLRDLAATPAPAAPRQGDARPGVPPLLGRPPLNTAARLPPDRAAGPPLQGARL